MSAHLVKNVYLKLLQSWNENRARDFAALFSGDGIAIGFDGSLMQGPEDIFNQLEQIFAHHQVARYTSLIKEVHALDENIWLLRAFAGMTPPGKKTINPDVNSVQTLIARKQGELFSIVLFQNTPAAFHGRPEMRDQLTEELQKTSLSLKPKAHH